MFKNICIALGAPLWAIRLEKTIINLQQTVNDGFDNIVAQFIDINNDIAKTANNSANHPTHALQSVRNAARLYPPWFPGTRHDLIMMTEQQARELIQFYHLNIVHGGDGTPHQRRLKAIADHIGVRDVF